MKSRLPIALSSVADQLSRLPATATEAVERGFAAGVADRLSAGTFTYTDRAALLTTGRHLGLDLTRANLIVALEQGRASPVRRPTVAPLLRAGLVVGGLCAWLVSIGL